VVYYPAGATCLPQTYESIFEPHNRFPIPHARLRRPTCVVGPLPDDLRERHNETFSDRYWSASREPQRSMTSCGYDPRQSPGLGYKRVVSCKDSFHGTDLLAVSEHGAPGRRPNTSTRTSSVAKGTASIPLPARAAEANRSTLIADIPFPAPGNV